MNPLSTLTEIEKRYLEKILNMSSGYVLDFTDATFDEFFRRYGIEIHGMQYQTYGKSKAKKMRAFWEKEPDIVILPVLSEMLDVYRANCELYKYTFDERLFQQCRAITSRLVGKSPSVDINTHEDSLSDEFNIPNIQNLPIETQVASIIELRLDEARKALSSGAYLSTIFLCGSVLEGVLLGAALSEPEKFNRSPRSPKRRDNKKVKHFYEWTLSESIDVAYDIGLLKLDVKKFSHELRDFRNYIHPYQQMQSEFAPDKYTAKLCFQAMKAALADIAGER